VRAEILAENANMVSVCRRLGFDLELKMHDATMEASIEL
jgi:hypothetical protein